MIGHIKLDRKILSWEWYNDANTFRVFIHLLLMATHKDGKYKGFSIKRGQVITGRLKLATTLSLSEMEIRTAINKLKSTGEITIQVTNRFSIVTICKYDVYQYSKNLDNQQNNQPSTKLATNNQPTINQQATTFNNVYNDKNVNNVNKLSVPNSFPNWKNEVISFINNEKFKKDFIALKNIGLSELEKRMWDFVLKLNDKMDFKNEFGLQTHFKNSYAYHVENGLNGNKSLSNGFVEIPADFDYNGENVLKW